MEHKMLDLLRNLPLEGGASVRRFRGAPQDAHQDKAHGGSRLPYGSGGQRVHGGRDGDPGSGGQALSVLAPV